MVKKHNHTFRALFANGNTNVLVGTYYAIPFQSGVGHQPLEIASPNNWEGEGRLGYGVKTFGGTENRPNNATVKVWKRIS